MTDQEQQREAVARRLVLNGPYPLHLGERRAFLVVGTGHPIPEQASYRGTALDGPLVWHLIERWPSAGSPDHD